MTHRDGFPRLSARSAWRGDAGHRKPRATQPESLGKPPCRSRRPTGSGRFDGGVGKPCRCPASPAAFLLPGGSPARSLWVIINETWYQYFVSVSRKSFSHSLGQEATFSLPSWWFGSRAECGYDRRR